MFLSNKCLFTCRFFIDNYVIAWTSSVIQLQGHKVQASYETWSWILQHPIFGFFRLLVSETVLRLELGVNTWTLRRQISFIMGARNLFVYTRSNQEKQRGWEVWEREEKIVRRNVYKKKGTVGIWLGVARRWGGAMLNMAPDKASDETISFQRYPFVCLIIYTDRPLPRHTIVL